MLKPLIEENHEDKIEHISKLMPPNDLLEDNQHKTQKVVKIKHCGKSLTIGVDIKFTSLSHSLDGQPGVATVYSVSPNSPGEQHGLKVGDRILSIFGVVAHTKKEFSRLFQQQREKIAKKKHPSRHQTVVLLIETPCSIAKAGAKKSADEFIKKNTDSTLLRTAGFLCRCRNCNDTVRYLCRDSLKCEETHSHTNRRHSVATTYRRNPRAAQLFIRSDSKKFEDFKHLPTLSKGLSSKKSSSSETFSGTGDTRETIELKQVFSFSNLAQRDRSRWGRRRTVS